MRKLIKVSSGFHALARDLPWPSAVEAPPWTWEAACRGDIRLLSPKAGFAVHRILVSIELEDGDERGNHSGTDFRVISSSE